MCNLPSGVLRPVICIAALSIQVLFIMLMCISGTHALIGRYVHSVHLNSITSFTHDCCPISVPSAPPLVYDVQAVSPHSATIRWDPPPWQQRNGRITSYTLSVRSSDGDVWQRNTTATWAGAQEGFVWTDLYQNGHFVVMIAATNVNGTGPFSRAKNFTTPLDGGRAHSVCVCVCVF